MALAGRLGGLLMRGDETEQAAVMLFITPDQKVPRDHPIRAIKPIVDRALASLSPVFNRMHPKRGRPSTPPEPRLKASLLIALYSIRSERQFCERLEYDLLFKGFLDLNIEDPAFDASTFSKNKERLLEHDVARGVFVAVRGGAALARWEVARIRAWTIGANGAGTRRTYRRPTRRRGWHGRAAARRRVSAMPGMS